MCENHYTEPYYFFLVLSLSKFIFLAVQDIFLSVILLQFVAFEQPMGILCWMLAFGDPDFAINYHKLLIVPPHGSAQSLLASGQATQPNGPKVWVKFMGTSPHPAKQPSNSKFTVGPVCPSDIS